jgi:hypothetical protein
MGQVTVSFEMSLANDFEGAAAYRQSVRDQISQDRDCKNGKLRFECFGVDGHGKAYQYRIYGSSPLFPTNNSPVRKVLDSLYIYVTLFKQLPAEEGKTKNGKRLKYLGRFFVDWRQGLPKDVWLAYDYLRNSLSFGAERYALKDDDVVQAGVYSLVEFFSGIIGASPNVSEVNLCEQNALSKDTCIAKIDAIYKGLALRDLTLAFPYPKHISLIEGQAATCTSDGRQFLLLHLPANIEEIDGLGNIENFKPDQSPQQTCHDLEVDSRG